MTLYSTRVNHWWNDSRGRAPITMEEWLSYVSADHELVPVPYMHLFPAARGGSVVRGELKGVWEWVVHPDYVPMCEKKVMSAQAWQEFLAAHGQKIHFCCNGNGIQVGVADDATLRKAKQIAIVFRAKVIDDNDRRY